jgi:hypothetical protein
VIRFDRGEDLADVERVQPGAWVKAQHVTVLREDPIEHENMVRPTTARQRT